MALDYLPSPGWAVIYGETPSADRWSELGENDDALATGVGIDDLAIKNRHLDVDSVTSDKLNPTISTEVIDGFTYRIFDYGSHVRYIGSRYFTSLTAGTEYGPYTYPAGVTVGTNAVVNAMAVAVPGGSYANMGSVSVKDYNTQIQFYSPGANGNGYFFVDIVKFA